MLLSFATQRPKHLRAEIKGTSLVDLKPDLGSLPLLGRACPIDSAENATGEKGKGGMAIPIRPSPSRPQAPERE